MWCYVAEEFNSEAKLMVVCDNKEQAHELFKHDLDHCIFENHDSIKEFEEAYGENYSKILEENDFSIPYEVHAYVENIIPVEIEQRKALPTHLGGWQVYTYEDYKNMNY